MNATRTRFWSHCTRLSISFLGESGTQGKPFPAWYRCEISLHLAFHTSLESISRLSWLVRKISRQSWLFQGRKTGTSFSTRLSSLFQPWQAGEPGASRDFLPFQAFCQASGTFQVGSTIDFWVWGRFFWVCYYLGSFILGLQIDQVWVFLRKLIGVLSSFNEPKITNR